MDKEVNKIRLIKLYSENDLFDAITFHDGINLILGEKYDDNIVAGRKTNGVGKSLCIEFLDFCFLNDYSYSRLKKIPEAFFPLTENVLLDLRIGDSLLTIKRNRKDEGTPLITRDGKNVFFDKLSDARNYLNDLLYSNLEVPNVPSFRNLLSILIRDEKSEFIDILKCHDVSKNIPPDLSPHLFLMGIDVNVYAKILNTIKQINAITVIIKNEKKSLTEGNKKISDVHAELNALNDDLSKMESAIDSFKSNQAFDSMQAELIELESMLEQLRNKQKIVKYEYRKIQTIPKPEEIDDSEIEIVYNQFKTDLGSVVIKSLNEVIRFKNKVEDFQKMLINQKAKELQLQLKELSEKISELDETYSKKISVLDQRGVLKNLKTTLKIFEEKKRSSLSIRLLFEEYEKTLLSIHEKIMGNKESSFSIETIDRANKNIPVAITLRIYDDGSHSVNRTKVFIYDVGLIFNSYTQKFHPQFLVHDNIFDVDQDTLVQCLNFLYAEEQKNDDFQYILTLNRDKIENEERAQLINMDIEDHTVAKFTKENKFLRCNYQEK